MESKIIDVNNPQPIKPTTEVAVGDKVACRSKGRLRSWSNPTGYENARKAPSKFGGDE